MVHIVGTSCMIEYIFCSDSLEETPWSACIMYSGILPVELILTGGGSCLLVVMTSGKIISSKWKGDIGMA